MGRFLLALALVLPCNAFTLHHNHQYHRFTTTTTTTTLFGWIERPNGEWEWQEEDKHYVAPVVLARPSPPLEETTSTPTLPGGSFRPKQSLGQNFLRDANTVNKIIRAFHKDAIRRGVDPTTTTTTNNNNEISTIIELGPGAGALTDPLVANYGTDVLKCIEIDPRSVTLLQQKHPGLHIMLQDVLQADYPALAQEYNTPLVIVGNLPYYITSQILFALADASHFGAVHSATVTMQWEVAQRMVAKPCTKDYGILSVVFQLYAETNLHFKIPPTVFYPQPKVDSALVGLHFLGPAKLKQKLAGVDPKHLRQVVTTSFQQRRKTVRNSLKKLVKELYTEENEEEGIHFFSQPPLTSLPLYQKEQSKHSPLPDQWASMRPEEFTPDQFVELTRLIFGPKDYNNNNNSTMVSDSTTLGRKVWRKVKHGN